MSSALLELKVSLFSIITAPIEIFLRKAEGNIAENLTFFIVWLINYVLGANWIYSEGKKEMIIGIFGAKRDGTI